MEMIDRIGVNFLKNTYLIVGVYILLGSIIEKKSIDRIISSIFKTFIGMFIMEIGVDVIGKSVSNLNYLIPKAFKFIGVIPQNEGAAALGEFRYGDVINSILFLGMAINILIAKFTRFKYIFLTGQQMIYMSSLLAIIMIPFGISHNIAIIIGGILLGIMMSIFPHILHPYTKIITKNNNIAVGHFSTIGFYLSSQIGKLFKQREKSENKNKLTKFNGILFDTTLVTAFFMVFIFTISSIISGKGYVEDISGGTNFLIFSFKQGLIFAAGVYIILNGVRMLIQEIIPAFRGIAKRLVPEAIVALDISILFPYKENIMLLGFLFSFLGGIFSMYMTSIYRVEVILPSVLIHFFTGGGCGMYGYSTGGKKGCIIASFLVGILIGICPLLLLDHYKEMEFHKLAFGEIDLSLVGYILKKVLSSFKI
ncbi:PTS ascorbate transporter subunit IIC [Tepidibacter formicigenes]|jgi:PTS system ascorbate-specific IIC component|uniref:Ascorbate-specific PTS system EIIC component n=1 Tax=Tepidibacter formicigenes DSM 15518 TaxID=1123349 RepID=A0A1M6PF70_9FIRM|nr:PTS ascorbate transporter subunit IIC [Tepidibacter formicigenes]SHK06605.1 PTS system, ascorbate-specific IIC component [Tepidibacter formicigenes DSM 15518]